jgi:hypothetical protein
VKTRLSCRAFGSPWYCLMMLKRSHKGRKSGGVWEVEVWRIGKRLAKHAIKLEYGLGKPFIILKSCCGISNRHLSNNVVGTYCVVRRASAALNHFWVMYMQGNRERRMPHITPLHLVLVAMSSKNGDGLFAGHPVYVFICLVAVNYWSTPCNCVLVSERAVHGSVLFGGRSR